MGIHKWYHGIGMGPLLSMNTKGSTNILRMTSQRILTDQRKSTISISEVNMGKIEF